MSTALLAKNGSVAERPAIIPSVLPSSRPVRLSRPSSTEIEARRASGRTRVRKKPETREQILERLANPQLSLHEVATLLRVAPTTVRRWSNSGKLRCERTPGGQRRFFWRDIAHLVTKAGKS